MSDYEEDVPVHRIKRGTILTNNKDINVEKEIYGDIIADVAVI